MTPIFYAHSVEGKSVEEWHKLEMKLSRKGFKYVFKC